MSTALTREQRRVVQFVIWEALELRWVVAKVIDSNNWLFMSPEGFEFQLVVESEGFRITVEGPLTTRHEERVGKVLTRLLDRALSVTGHACARGFVPSLLPLKRPE